MERAKSAIGYKMVLKSEDGVGKLFHCSSSLPLVEFVFPLIGLAAKDMPEANLSSKRISKF